MAQQVTSSRAGNLRRVVIVDDDDLQLRAAWRAARRDPDLELVVATNAIDGLLTVGTMRPDIVVFDVFMPGVDGIAQDLVMLVRVNQHFIDSFMAGANVAMNGEEPPKGLRLDLRGTPFQCRVWEKLRAIPVGRTVTYTELARWVGPLTSARAVAGACAANPIALAVPCHRVVRIDGALADYRWGIERKREFIRREAEG